MTFRSPRPSSDGRDEGRKYYESPVPKKQLTANPENETMVMRRTWNDEQVEAEVRMIAAGLGHFPSNSELVGMGRNDLSNQISRRGGFLHWAEKIGICRRPSCSDTGWEGESQAMSRLIEAGFVVTRPRGVKCPFDLLVNDLLRVDVKSARRARYGSCVGWFYRVAKVPQADLILLWQLDTGDFYALPWFICPRTSITISRDGGKYAAYCNNLQIIQDMLAAREAERDRLRFVASMN